LKRRILFFSAAALLLTGCQLLPGTSFSNIALPNIADTSTIPAGLGTIILRVNVLGDWSPDVRLFLNKKGIMLARAIVVADQRHNFVVISLPAGRYNVSEIMLSGRGAVMAEDFTFEVSENQLTYIGDIDLALNLGSRQYAIAFADRYSATVPRLNKEYPLLMAAYPPKIQLTHDPRPLK
jgi:hypothetical protein